MLDAIPITLTVIAMIIDLIVLFILVAVTQRTKGKFRWTLIFMFVAIFFLFVRRILNLLDVSNIFNSEISDDILSIFVATLFLIAMIYLFRDVRGLTDVEVNHRREARFPPPRQNFNRFERPEPPREFERQERNEERGEDNYRPTRETRRLKVVNGYVDFTNS
jgi:hypothetical protein